MYCIFFFVLLKSKAANQNVRCNLLRHMEETKISLSKDICSMKPTVLVVLPKICQLMCNVFYFSAVEIGECSSSPICCKMVPFYSWCVHGILSMLQQDISHECMRLHQTSVRVHAPTLYERVENTQHLTKS